MVKGRKRKLNLNKRKNGEGSPFLPFLRTGRKDLQKLTHIATRYGSMASSQWAVTASLMDTIELFTRKFI
ncbi:MAG: hypothetical protein ACTSRZ_16780 [Promethearchaeota archaeon]